MEDWKKKYNDAIIGIKAVYENADAATRAALETKFPELAESEDERIRKWIVNFIEVRLPDAEEFEPEYRAALAYLEKQKDEVQKQFNLGVQAGREEAMYEMEKEKMGEPKEWADELSAEIDRISKRYPEVSFAKLSRVAVHFSRWQKEQQTPDSLLCDLDLFASSREDCEKIRVHIRSIRKIIAGIPDEQKPAEWSEEDFPKDIEKDATQFCIDKGINITPHQAKEIATHFLMVGHNEGYVKGRKDARIPAKKLGLPSSMD